MNKRHPYLLNSDRTKHKLRQSQQAPILPQQLNGNIISNQISFIEEAHKDKAGEKNNTKNQFQLLRKQDLEIISKLTKSHEFKQFKDLQKLKTIHMNQLNQRKEQEHLDKEREAQKLIKSEKNKKVEKQKKEMVLTEEENRQMANVKERRGEQVMKSAKRQVKKQDLDFGKDDESVKSSEGGNLFVLIKPEPIQIPK